MAFYRWETTTTAYTSLLKSFSYFLGRTSVDSPCNTTALTATFYNNTESTFPIGMNDSQGVKLLIGGTQYANVSGNAFDFSYNDEPGSGVNSTITIDFLNALGLISLKQLTGASISAGTTQDQVATINGLVSENVSYFGVGASRFNMAAQTFTGSPGDYVRTLANAENAYLISINPSECGYSTFSGGFVVSPCTIGRTATSTQLGYQSIRRIRYTKPFYNQVTVTPTSGLAAQTETNTASVTAYGEKAYNLNTYYSTETQADSAASWYANAFSDTNFRFEVDFLLDAQNSAAITRQATTDTNGTFNTNDFGTLLFGGGHSGLFNIYYRAPGAVSDTIVPCIGEGIQVTATPESTFCTMYFTPANVYSQFILNNNYFGVLDTDRLGW